MKSLIKHLEELKSKNNISLSLYALKIPQNGSNFIACALPLSHSDDFKSYFSAILEESIKVLADHPIEKYIPGTKLDGDIDVVEKTSQIVLPTLNYLSSSIIAPETNVVNPQKYNSFVLVASISSSDKVYFIAKKAPFFNIKKKSLILINEHRIGTENSYRKAQDSDFLQLPFYFDCIVIKSFCYFLTNKCENIFQLTRYWRKQTEENIERLVEIGLLDEEGKQIIGEYLKKPGKYQCLVNYSDVKAQYFSTISTVEQKQKIELQHGITLIKNQANSYVPDLTDEKNIEVFIEMITDRRALDPIDGTSVKSRIPFTPAS